MSLKRRKGIRGVITGLIAFACSLSIIPAISGTPVHADGEQTTGSITIYKYVSNDKSSFQTDGSDLASTTSQELDAVRQKANNYKMIPEQGVRFSYLKIADVTETGLSTDGTNTNQITDRGGGNIDSKQEAKMEMTNVNPSFISVLNAYGVRPQNDTSFKNNTNYSFDEIKNALTNLNRASISNKTGETAVRELVKNNGTAFPDATSQYGKTVARNIPIGIYLVAETDWEHQTLAKHDTYWQRVDGTRDAGDGSGVADIVSPSSPFLVQMPIPDPEHSGQYIYDVTAYPKNGTLGIHKDIIVNDYTQGKDNDGLDTSETETMCDYSHVNYLADPESSNGNGQSTKLDADQKEGLTHQIDANIGDTISYLISSDVPALIGDKKNKTYKLSDFMTKGLTFKQIQKVTMGTDTWNEKNTELYEGADYTISVPTDKHSFTITLTPRGLGRLDALTQASYLYVQYDATLNKDAQIGTSTYQYKTHDGTTTNATNQNTAMLTYATDRTSEHDYYSNTVRVYTYQMNINKVFGNTGSGTYSDVQFKLTGNTSTGTKPVTFIKENNGVYHVYDAVSDGTSASTTTVISPDNQGNLKIKGVDAREYTLTEIKTSKNNNLLAEPLHIELDGHKLADEDDRFYENGALDHAYVWTGKEKPDYRKLKVIDVANTGDMAMLSTGIASFRIQNDRGVQILRTGGKGDTMLYLFGGSLMIAGFVMLNIKRREEGKI